MTKVGMVILNYNDCEETKKYIERIRDYKVLDKIVVVDNNSTDGSYDKLKRYENNNDKIYVVKVKENKGYAGGNNIGVSFLDQYKIDYVIISNPDIIVNEDAILKLKKDLDSNENIAAVGPVIKQLGEEIKGWRLPRYKDELLSNINYFQRKAKQKLYYDESRYKNDLTKVDVLHGCFFMIRKNIFDLVGGFDDSTFLYYEENILAYKLKNIGKKQYIDKKVYVVHDLSVSVNKAFSSINKYKILKTSQKYYAKYYLKINGFEMFILRFTYRISLFISYIVCLFKSIGVKEK